MHGGPAGVEAERPGLHRLADVPAHQRQLRVGGGRVGGAALAHGVDAQRRVTQVGAYVQPERQPRQRVEVLGEGLPVPTQPGLEGGLRDVLDSLHEEHEIVAVLLLAGGEADTAVADDDRGDAVQVRRRAERVPGDLRVEVRVDVDEARGDDLAAGVDDLGGGAVVLAHGGNSVPGDGDVGLERRSARAVDNGSSADHEISFHARLLLVLKRRHRSADAGDRASATVSSIDVGSALRIRKRAMRSAYDL